MFASINYFFLNLNVPTRDRPRCFGVFGLFSLSFCFFTTSKVQIIMPATNLPRNLRKLVATQFSPKFRDVVAVAEDPMPEPSDDEVLIKNRQVIVKLNCWDMLCSFLCMSRPRGLDIISAKIGRPL